MRNRYFFHLRISHDEFVNPAVCVLFQKNFDCLIVDRKDVAKLDNVRSNELVNRYNGFLFIAPIQTEKLVPVFI